MAGIGEPLLIGKAFALIPSLLMKIGIFGGAVNDGTVDDVVAEARAAEQDGFASYWAPNIFGHDALTALAIVGRKFHVLNLVHLLCPHTRATRMQLHSSAIRLLQLQVIASRSALGLVTKL